jgi:hypothetical protein
VYDESAYPLIESVL